MESMWSVLWEMMVSMVLVEFGGKGAGLRDTCEISAEDEFLRGDDGFGSCGLCNGEFRGVDVG